MRVQILIVFGLQNVSLCKSCDISRLKDLFFIPSRQY